MHLNELCFFFFPTPPTNNELKRWMCLKSNCIVYCLQIKEIVKQCAVICCCKMASFSCMFNLVGGFQLLSHKQVVICHLYSVMCNFWRSDHLMNQLEGCQSSALHCGMQYCAYCIQKHLHTMYSIHAIYTAKKKKKRFQGFKHVALLL